MADYTATYVAPVIRSSGKVFADLQAGGLAGILDAVIAAQSALTAPSQPTFTGSGTAGSLAAGTYFGVVTAVTPWGEVAAPESAQFTLTSTQSVAWTAPALVTGQTCWNLYLTKAGGAAGTETLYDTGIPAGAYLGSKAKFAGTAIPPTANGTAPAAAGRGKELLGLAHQQRLQYAYQIAASTIDKFLQGDPIAFDEVRAKLAVYEAAARVVVQALSEATSLITANSGTVASGIGSNLLHVRSRRTFP